MSSNKSLSYQRESYFAIQDEVKSLLMDHWEELASHKDKIKLNPDFTTYEMLDSTGTLGVYTARSEGKLVGYFSIIAKKHPHYQDHYFATNDLIYLHPDYRKGMAGYKLIKFVEDDLKRMGVSVLLINTTIHLPFDPLLERMGFGLEERIYSKYLGD